MYSQLNNFLQAEIYLMRNQNTYVMFIRRNMSSNVSYQELKEYPCFKELSKVIDVLILKQILPMVVKKVSLDIAKDTLNKSKMMYIPQENAENLSIINLIDATISGIGINSIIKNNKDSNKMRFFMIEIKIYNILKYLFFKRIQCMEHLKNFQKLNFFYRSNLDQVPFGGYVYRKDDQITSIYYLLRGQIKIAKSIDQKQITICTIYQDTFFGLYQFNRNKIKRILNAQSSSNSTIVLSISLDMLIELFGKDENEVLNKLLALPSEIEKTLQQESKKMNSKQIKQKGNTLIKAYEFQRRLIKFSQQREIDKGQSAFGRFVENKSLLYKIKDSNDSIPRVVKQKGVRIVSNFHKNESMMKYYTRLNRHRLYKMDSNIYKCFMKNEKQNGLNIASSNMGVSSNDMIKSGNLSNMTMINSKMLNIQRGGTLLSSRLKDRYNKNKNYYQSTGIGELCKGQNSLKI